MHDYSIGDVERLVGLSRGVVRSLIRQRFVAPHRGRRREYRFSFQDLLVLRTAKALESARVSSRRISRSLRDLRQRLPERMPLSGLSLRAVGDSVSIREGQSEWDSDSGQYLLALDVLVRKNGAVRIIEHPSGPAASARVPAASRARSSVRRGAADELDAEGLFEQALRLEAIDATGALRLYRRALELDAECLEARINGARLLQEGGEFDAAEQLYRAEACGQNAQALFNLAVLLEDTGRFGEAIDAYLAALAVDPDLADAHFNLARLYELQGNDPHMIRHLRCYRLLAPGRGSGENPQELL